MKRITKRMLAVLLALVMVIGFVPGNLSVSAEEATTYYVATTGNDETGNGTEANPYASIQKALAAIEDDSVETTIIVAAGAYNVFVPSDNHGLVINKNNVTIKAADGAKPILYSYLEVTTYNVHNQAPTVRIDGAGNVTLDGLTVLPAMNATELNNFKNAVSANALREFVGAATAEDKTLYMHNDSNGGTGAITITNNLTGKTVTGSVTIQNCSIGYATAAGSTTYPFCFGVGMNGDYHVKNNAIYGRASLVTHGVPTEGTNELLNNDLYYGGFYVNLPVGNEAGLPRIRENRLHSAYQYRAANGAYLVIYSTSARATYTSGEASVIAQSNAAYENFLYGYHLVRSADVANIPGSVSSGYPGIAYTTTSGTNYKYYDTTMDTQEELGYYLGKEGNVTLTQNFTITKAGILPEEIKATVDFGEYKITKTEGLELPAPDGYRWNENILEVIPAWISTALLLQNDLNMKFYVAADRVANGEYLVVTMNGKEVTLSNWQDGTGANAGKKFVTFEGIAATRMATEVSVQLVDAGGNAVAGCDHVDSIRMYAERLKAAYGDNEGYRNLMNALLDYGAAAQKIETPNVADEDLANYGWTWAPAAQ